MEQAEAQSLFRVPECSALTSVLLSADTFLCCAQVVSIKIVVFSLGGRDSRLASVSPSLPFLTSLVLTPCNPGEVLGPHIPL